MAAADACPEEEFARDVLNPQQLIEELLCEEDGGDLMREAETLRDVMKGNEVIRQRRRPPRQLAPDAGPAPDSPPAIVDIGDWNQREAKKYLPPMCKITMHLAGGQRWTLTSPDFEGSRDRTVSFGRVNSCFQALCTRLKLAWVRGLQSMVVCAL